VNLLPREHGAYGQMAFPLVTAFGVAGVSAGGLLLATAIVVAARPPAATRLRVLGWSLVTVSTLTAAIVLVTA
jgi:hypothetical protein